MLGLRLWLWLHILLLLELFLLSTADCKQHCIFIGKLTGDLVDCIFGQIFIGLAKVYWAVRIGAVLAEATHFLVFVELALLSFVIVIGDVEELELHFDWQRVHLDID